MSKIIPSDIDMPEGLDRIDVCSVWTLFGRYFYKSVPKMTTGCKKPESSKPHYNEVFSSLQKKAKTLSGSSTPVSGTRPRTRGSESRLGLSEAGLFFCLNVVSFINILSEYIVTP